MPAWLTFFVNRPFCVPVKITVVGAHTGATLQLIHEQMLLLLRTSRAKCTSISQTSPTHAKIETPLQ
jgi:hypothetical protein